MSDEQNPLGEGGLQGLFQQAQTMQHQLQEAQARAASRTVVGESGGGLVKVTANGAMQIVRVEIEPKILSIEEKEMLEDLVAAAINAALARAKELVAEEMGPIGRMLQMSGLGGLGM